MLVYLCYFLFLVIIIKYKPQQNLLLSLCISTLYFSVLIVALTELLSCFNCLNLACIASCWSLLCLALISLLFKNKAVTCSAFKFNRNKITHFYKSLIFKEKALLSIVGIFILLLFIQGLIYPPNNWDSLTYHMSRIMYWLGNESVAYYPTHILRHLYQPPFAEYFILHINLLNGNDYLSNSVELFFLVQILFLTYAFLSLFQISRFLKILALLLIIAIPSVELQATTTKNDIVCCFFIISALYFAIKSIQENSIKNYLLLGLSVGLAFLTKGTAYLFLSPIALCFVIAVLHKIWTKKEFKLIGYCLSVLLLILALNVTHYARNYRVNNSILNVDDAEAKGYSNDVMGGSFLFSNLLKNAGLHLGFPIDKPSDYLIRTIHSKMGISLDDKRLNYNNTPYQSVMPTTTHEDFVPNTIPFLLTCAAFLLILITGFNTRFKNKTELLMAGIVVSQIILFSAYLKWQPWHTRLHIPIFIIGVFVIVFAIQGSKYQKWIIYCTPFIISSFLFYFLFNNLRPIIESSKLTKGVSVTDNRFKKYFSNQPQLYNEYSDVLDDMYAANPSKIGLCLGDWEYPLLNSYYYDHLKIVAVNVFNITSSISQDGTGIDAIISNTNTPTITYNGITYINQNNNHSYIWFYKKTKP